MAEGIVAGGVEAALGERLLSTRPMGGGCIGEVYKAELTDGSTVVAKVDRTGESYLMREAYMLRYLQDKTELPVPEVYHSTEKLLLMEFVDGGGDLSEAQEHAAELLARLHSVTADAYGLERDTLIGSLSQPNLWTPSWVEFFREQRLLYLAAVTRETGRLPANLYGRVEKLAARLEEFLGEPGGPSLIHGDVWVGNVLAKGSRITAFLDPAIYYADSEIELAYITLFGTFDEKFFRRYAEIQPIKPDFFEERRHLYNLYPLLVHVYFFGGHYVNSVDSILRRFGF